MAAVEIRFRVMGGFAHVRAVDASPDVVTGAMQRLRHLERLWSRFRVDSELSRLNDTPGRPIVVSDETFMLVERSVAGHDLTGGRFDPSVGPTLEALGYDVSHEFLTLTPDERPPRGLAGPAPTSPEVNRPAPGTGGLRLDPMVGAITLPPGTRLDPGGIGKGLAGDLVVKEMLDAGADGALVNLGGDVRVAGRAIEPGGWVVSVEDPFDPEREVARIQLSDGAVVTSSRHSRTWNHGGRRCHHLVDSRLGRPAETGLASVTVVAGEAWWAEVVAKAAFLAGPDAPQVIRDLDATGFAIDDEGHRLDAARLSEVLV